jgi:multiple sugar transport system substrate-binding protein
MWDSGSIHYEVSKEVEMGNYLSGRTPVVAAVLVLCVLLSGFASGGKEQVAEKKVTIKVILPSDGVEGRKITGPYIKAFEEETGHTVEWTEVGWKAIHGKAAAAFAAKSTDVDLVGSWKAWTEEFAYAGYLEDITDRLEPELKKDLNAATNSVTYKGRLYGLPKFASVRNFLYNERMFREAGIDPSRGPVDWYELIEYAKKLTKDGQYGMLAGFGNANNCTFHYQDILVTTDESFFDANDDPSFGSADGILCMEILNKLARANVFDPASFGVHSGGSKRSAWLAGNAAMEHGWAAAWVQSNDPKVSKIVGEVRLALAPGLKNKSGVVSGSEGFVVSKFSKKQDQALDLLRFIVKPENQKDMTMRTGWMPVRWSVFKDEQLRKENALVAHVEEQLKYRTYRFGAPYASEIIDMFGGEVLEVVKGDKEPAKAIADAVEKSREIVKTYK